jgi:hypothetical protein
MDHYSILDRSSASQALDREFPPPGASRSATASVSAGIAAANAHLPKPAEPEPRFPGEDAGRSLAEMAHSDLDAALQLLADRAQYITGSSGAAIALRRGQQNDMVCRASVGSNAPELGALLSMEYGLSGECVRSRQPLRCDDAERDPRVNRQVCRDLGIASVVVMPILSERQVLGVFELFSGKPRAFEERDLSALQRLGEMVETAVKHAAAAPILPVAPQSVDTDPQPALTTVAANPEAPASVIASDPDLDNVPLVKDVPPVGLAQQELAKQEPAQQEPEKQEPTTIELKRAEPEKPNPAQGKPLFWSAALQTPAAARTRESVESITVPPVLRNLQKCQACGFPVSQGRTFCVECEEKQFRGQRLPQPAAANPPSAENPAPPSPPENGHRTTTAPVSVATSPQNPTAAPVESPIAQAVPVSSPELTQNAPPNLPQFTQDVPNLPPALPASDAATPFLSSAMPSESWFAANKYILGALLVVALIIAGVAWLR